MKDYWIAIAFAAVVVALVAAERATRPQRMSAEEFDEAWDELWDDEDVD
jgi:hypothetical protein